MLCGTRERTGHVGRDMGWQCSPQCVPPPELAWTQETARHSWAGISEARLPCGCFRHLGRDPRANRAQESTAKKGMREARSRKAVLAWQTLR